MNSTIKMAAKVAEKLNHLNEKSDTKKEGIQHTKENQRSKNIQHIRIMDRQITREGDTFLWLSKEDVKREKESEIIAAQDQALQTMRQKRYKEKQITNSNSVNNLMGQWDTS